MAAAAVGTASRGGGLFRRRDEGLAASLARSSLLHLQAGLPMRSPQGQQAQGSAVTARSLRSLPLRQAAAASSVAAGPLPQRLMLPLPRSPFRELCEGTGGVQRQASGSVLGVQLPLSPLEARPCKPGQQKQEEGGAREVPALRAELEKKEHQVRRPASVPSIAPAFRRAPCPAAVLTLLVLFHDGAKLLYRM
jgi:hypothetical protein